MGIGITYFFIEFFWKFSFNWGIFYGIYWLFVFADKTAPLLIVTTFGLVIILFLVYIVMKIIKKGNHEVVSEIALVFLLCVFILMPTFFSWFPQNTIHVDSARIDNRVYCLAVSPMLDLNYKLYQCDIAGIFCKNIYHSGDVMSQIDAKLKYNLENHTLSIVSKEVGEIYEYKLP